MKLSKLAVLSFLILMYATLGLFILKYLLPFVIGFIPEEETILSELFEPVNTFSIILNVILIINTILNIIIAIHIFKQNNLENARNSMKKIKLYLIPYWVINFIFSLTITGVTLFMGGIIMGFIFLIQTYLLFIATSCYSISFLGILLKNKKISLKSFIIHLLLQFCFVMDIIDTIYLLRKYKNNVVEQDVIKSCS